MILSPTKKPKAKKGNGNKDKSLKDDPAICRRHGCKDAPGTSGKTVGTIETPRTVTLILLKEVVVVAAVEDTVAKEDTKVAVTAAVVATAATTTTTTTTVIREAVSTTIKGLYSNITTTKGTAIKVAVVTLKAIIKDLLKAKAE